MAFVRRDQLGLAALAVVAAVFVVATLMHRPRAAPRDDGRDSPDGGPGDGRGWGGWGEADAMSADSFFDDLEMPRERPPFVRQEWPERPPILPPITFADGTVAMLTGIERVPARGGFAGALLGGAASAERSAEAILVRLRFRGASPPEDEDHVARISGRRARGVGVPGVSGDGARQTMAAAIAEPGAARVRVEVGVATGPFVEAQRFTLDDAAPSAIAPGAPLRIESAGSEGGWLVVTLADAVATEDLADRSWLLQAVRHDGQRVTPSLVRASGGGVRVSFTVLPRDVAYVVYRHRPYVWQPLGEIDVPAAATSTTAARPNARREMGASASGAGVD